MSTTVLIQAVRGSPLRSRCRMSSPLPGTEPAACAMEVRQLGSFACCRGVLTQHFWQNILWRNFWQHLMRQGRPIRLGAKVDIEVVVNAQAALLVVDIDLRSNGSLSTQGARSGTSETPLYKSASGHAMCRMSA